MTRIYLFVVLFIFILTNLVSAYIESEIKIYNISENNERNIIELGELEIVYYLTNGEKYLVEDNGGDFIFKQEDLFCWTDCNIYPDYKIYKEEIKENGEVIALHDTNIVNGEVKNVRNLFEIYKNKKIIVEDKEETIVSSSNADSLSNKGDFYVEWNGELRIEKERDYNFLINVSGGVKIIINGTEVLNDLEQKQDNQRIFNLTLASGNYSINISYWSNEDYGKTNLFWKNKDLINEPVPKSNLRYMNGTITRFSSELEKKRSFSISSFPESYNIDYGVYPSGVVYIPQNIENSKPIILVHGLHGEYPYWYNIPEQLIDFDNDVWEFYYQETNVSNFMTSGLLESALDTVLSYYPTNTKANIVAHSMGTLITLGYIENLGKYPNGNQVDYQNDIENVVLIAGPIHGSHHANRVMNGESAGLICGLFVDPNDPKAQAYYDVAFGSEFTWLLHKNGLNQGVRYISIAGSDDDLICLPFEADTSDSFVSASSASLLNFDIPLVLIKANHDNLRGHCWTAFGDRCKWNLFDGFYFDDKMSDLIDKFFEGASKNTLKSKLYSGEYYVANSSDLSNVPFNEGIAIIKFTNYESFNISEVKIKKNNIEYLFTRNNQTNIFYHYNYGEGPFLSCIGNKFGKLNLTLNDLICIAKIGVAIHTGDFDPSLVSCLNSNLAQFGIQLVTQDVQQCLSIPIDYGLTIPQGTYDLYINNLDTSFNVAISPLQTKIYEIELNNNDMDLDGTSNDLDACPSVFGQYCNGCSKPSCQARFVSFCPNSGIPTCVQNTCQSNWSCTQWSQCVNSQQTRICTDLNLCGTNNDKPNEIQVCQDDTQLLVNSPYQKLFNDRRVPFNLISAEKMNKLEYIDNSRLRPRWTTLCSNCFSYNISKTLSEGNHTLVFRGVLLNGQNITNQSEFLIDSTEPRISTTKPQSRRYTNGRDFYIKYTEDNCENIKLLLGSSEQDIGACESGRNIEESIIQNLEVFDGTEIEYKFIIRDIANNIDESRPTKIKVDTTAPEIGNFITPINGRQVSFNMTILNENKDTFDVIEYMDNSDSNPRWRILCSSLKNNVCFKKVSFKVGSHNVMIRVLDNAGNSVGTSIQFIIV